MITAICWLAFSTIPYTGSNQIIHIRVDEIVAVKEIEAKISAIYLQGTGASSSFVIDHSAEEVFIMMSEDCNSMD